MGRGKDFTKEKTIEAIQKFLQRYKDQMVKDCTPKLGKLNPDKTKATLPDGTQIPVNSVGQPKDHAPIFTNCSTPAGAVAQTQDLVKCVIDGKTTIGLIMERMSDGLLYIRKIGEDLRYVVPSLLPSQVSPDQYVGGFSSNGNMFYLGGNYTENYGEDVHACWAIFSDISINSNGLNYTLIDSGKINLKTIYDDNFRDQVSPPSYGETTTPGLLGEGRTGYIWKYWADPLDEPPDYSVEELEDFVNQLIEFFELTPEDIELLFGPGGAQSAIAVSALQDNQTNRFFPFTNLQYNTVTLPTFGSTSGQLVTREDTQDGFWSREWDWDPNHKLTFMQVGFAFNNNVDGSPILDIVGTYKSSTVYFVTEISYETNIYWTIKTVGNPGFAWMEITDWWARMNSETYGPYSYSSSYPFSPDSYNSIINSDGEEIRTLNYTATYLDPTIDPAAPEIPASGNNFSLISGNLNVVPGNTSDGRPFVPGAQQIYSVLFNNYYRNPGQVHYGECDFSTASGIYNTGVWPDCPWYKQLYPPYTVDSTPVTYGWNKGGSIDAIATFYSGTGPVIIFYYPPDEVEYTSTTFDGVTTDIAAQGAVPTAPTYFDMLPTLDLAGFFCMEDAVVWPGVNPFANVYQFGRGILTVKNANTSPTYAYLDRPPAQSRDFDTIDAIYLGVNQTRAINLKEDYYDIYGYAQDYTSLNNQIIGLDRPDTFTNEYFINKGTWPFSVNYLKAVNSRDFVQYFRENGKEYIENVHVNPTGSSLSDQVDFEGQVYGNLPSTTGTMVDFVIVGSEYE